MYYLQLSCVLGLIACCSDSQIACADSIDHKSSIESVKQLRSCMEDASEIHEDVGYDPFYSTAENMMLFRAFIVSAKHLPIDDSVDLLSNLFNKAHAKQRWIELGQCYLYSLHAVGNEQLQEADPALISNIAKKPLAKYLLSGTYATNGRLLKAIETYSDTQEHSHRAIEYHPFHMFMIDSARFGLMISPPEFVIAKRAIENNKKNLIEELMGTFDGLEKYFAYSGMSSAYFRRGDSTLARQALENAVDSLFKYSAEVNWYAFSNYDKRIVAESLIWLAFVKANDGDHESLLYVGRKIANSSSEQGSPCDVLNAARLATVFAISKNKEQSQVYANKALSQIAEDGVLNDQQKAIALASVAAAYSKLGMSTKTSELFSEITRINMTQTVTHKNEIWEFAGHHWFDSGLSWSQIISKMQSETDDIRSRIIIGYLTGISASRNPPPDP